MADQLEYIVRNALMVCDKGAAPAFFLPTHNTHVKIQGLLVANKLDKQPLVNIPTFGICSLTQKPCVPRWEDTVCDQRSDSVARGCNGRHQGPARARG